MLRTILWAVPAFMRDDPARTSGPTCVTMARWAARSRGEFGLQVRAMVRAPRRRASAMAETVNGGRPLEAMPRTTSFLFGLRADISLRPGGASSSLVSDSEARALLPPARMNWTERGSVLKVGGHSTASRAAMRPLVPAPTY